MSRYGKCWRSPRSVPTAPPTSTDSCTWLPAHRPSRPIVEPQLVVGVPVGRANPAPQVEADPRHAVPVRRRFAGEQVPDLFASSGVTRSSASSDRIQSWRGQLGRMVLLVDVTGPRPRRRRDRSEAPRDRHGLVRALGVDDDDLVGPRDALERGRDVRGLVAGDDRDRQLRHGGSVARPLHDRRAHAIARGRTRRPRLRHRANSPGRSDPPPAMTRAPALPLTGASWTVSKSTSDLLKSRMRVQLGALRLRQVALRLEDQKAGRHAGRELLLLGLEPLAGPARASARVACHPLRVRVDLPARPRGPASPPAARCS